MGDLSPHFSTHEFRSRDGGPGLDALNIARLVAHLEVLRCRVGNKPMTIVSGHRSQSHNAAVGGAKDSMHLRSLAADLLVGYCSPAQAQDAGFTGIGTKGPWAVHVDLRDKPARWTY